MDVLVSLLVVVGLPVLFLTWPHLVTWYLEMKEWNKFHRDFKSWKEFQRTYTK